MPCLQNRILGVLVSVSDRDERRQFLPEAFTPPECSSGAEDGDDGEGDELLHTTPLQLLQVFFSPPCNMNCSSRSCSCS